MSRESVGDKIGNVASDVSGGTIGESTLFHQTLNLVNHTLDYAKGVVGIQGAAGARSPSDAVHGSHGVQSSQTLGDLVNESRDLAASVIRTTRHITKRIVAGSTATVNEVAQNNVGGTTADVTNDLHRSVKEEKAMGYVASVRNFAAAVVDRPLEIAQNIIASGAQKIDENTPGGASSGTTTDRVANTAGATRDAAANGAQRGQSALANAAGDAYSRGAVAADKLDQRTRGAQEIVGNVAKTALGGVARAVDIGSDKVTR